MAARFGQTPPFHYVIVGGSMRHLITAGFVAAALVAYYFGLDSGSGVLFIAGAVFEIISFKRLRSGAAS